MITLINCPCWTSSLSILFLRHTKCLMKNTVLGIKLNMFKCFNFFPLLFYLKKIVVSLRLKRQLFDQVMLVRRMEEEKIIIVKEMTQHYQHLKKTLDKLDILLRETKEDIKIHSMYSECFLFK